MPYMATIQACEAKVGEWVAAGADASHSSEAVRKGCAAAVKALTGAPQTSLWRRGKKVKGNNILPGTAIATFPTKVGTVFMFKGHAAILAEIHATGLVVYDQYNTPEKPFGKRTIKFVCGGYVSNDGEAFYVIEAVQDPLTTNPALCSSTSTF